MQNPLVKKYGDSKQWVSWKYRVVDGRKTKIPVQENGKLAASTNPEHWSTFDDIKKSYDNIGIVFKPDQLLLGIDMDHVLEGKEIVHEEKQKIAEFIIEANTYCEISPSGTGLHLYLALTEPLKLSSNKKAPYELYTSGRYFTTTLNPYKEAFDVRTVTPKEALELLSMLGYPWKEAPVQALVDKVQKTSSMTDEEVVKKMLKAKNGDDIKKIMDGDTSAYKNDTSSAEMALLSHLAFWTKKDASQMERIWLASPIANREKTQERDDYRTRSIQAAIDNCKEVYETKANKLIDENPDLNLLYILSDKKDKIFLRNTENMCRVLTNHQNFKGRFRYDIFQNIYEIKEKDKWRMLEDNDSVVIQTEISVLFPDFFGTVGKDMIYDAIIKVSKENSVDSAIEYITSIAWDKKSRLDTWLHHVYGVDNDAYHKAVGSNWLKGLVKRIIEPGCKFDYVLVLEGEQGAKKSTSLAILGGHWHVETTMSTESKDFFMQFQGKAIIEFSEGETLSRTEVKRMKAIITTQVDKYRMPYERASKDYPRRCVFAMTTNQDEYLKDETGNRRWLPVRVVFPEADIEWLKENRDQLIAEAYHRVSVLKETVHEFPKDETAKQQDARRILDANSELIVDWYWNKLNAMERREGITVFQVYRDALCGGYVHKILDKYIEMRITEVIKLSLNLQKKRVSVDGDRQTKWVQTQDEKVVEEVDYSF